MKILVFGAGVLGSLYAARLKQSGQDVTILARQQRFVDIQEHGIVLEHALSHKKEVVPIPVVERLREDDAYDLIVVLVRKNQVSSVLPTLASHHNTPNILFMVNNPSGYDDWISAVGRERLLLGFAGAGGRRVGNVVHYAVVSRFLQPTTFGELDGSITPRVEEILRAFRGAGFPVALASNMDAWQKTHAAWVSPVANAIYMVDGDNHKLARSPHAVRLVVRAVRESFQVLRSLGIPVTPAKLQVWEWMPECLVVCFLRLWADTDHFRAIAVDHTLAAADEMWQLAEEFHTLSASTSIKTPATDELRSFIPRPGREEVSV
jgi:2-dehydropantoate 2-reductase